MFSLRLILSLAALVAPLSIHTVVRADPDAKLVEICSSESSTALLKDIEEARGVLDHYFAERSSLCDAKYNEGFTALRALLSDSMLNNVCSNEAVDSIHRFHVDFIYDLTSEMSDEEINSRKKIAKSERTKPLPKALKVFFILFAKQVNAQCTQHFVDTIDEYGRDQNLVRDEELEIIRNVTNTEKGPLKKLRHKVRKWVFKRGFGDLEYVKPAELMPVAVPYKPVVVKLHNLCSRRFRALLDHLLEPVVRLNNMGYMDHFVLSEETRRRLKEDETITRWYGAFQYCEAMKNVELIVLQEQVKGKSKGYPVKMGFLSEQLATEARKLAVPIEDESLESIEIAPKSVRLEPNVRTLSESEVRFELKQQKRASKETLKGRTSLVTMAEKRFVMSALRRLGIQPLPTGLRAEPPPGVWFFISIFLILMCIMVSIQIAFTVG